MLSRIISLLVVWFIVGLASVAGAQITPAGGAAAGDDTQPASARVGAVIFWDYTFQSSPKQRDAAGNDISFNSFNVARAYLNVTGNISHVVSYRITPDINATRFSLAGNNLDGSLVFRLKYAYAQISLTDWTGPWTQSYIRAGVQQTPFIDYQESIYRYRFQGTVFAERDALLSSADTGVSFHTNLPNLYGDVHVGLYNGENYNKPEVNNQKALMVRGTVRPMPAGSSLTRGIRLTAFHVADHVVADARRSRTILNVALEQQTYNVNVDVLTSKVDQSLPTAAEVKQDGFSVFVTPFFQEKGNGWEALVRFDSLRPDKENAPDRRQNRTIVGVAYWFPHPGGNGTSAIMLDYEGVSVSNPAQATPKQRRIFVHGLINF